MESCEHLVNTSEMAAISDALPLLILGRDRACLEGYGRGGQEQHAACERSGPSCFLRLETRGYMCLNFV